METLAESILVRELAFRERFADEGDLWRSGGVALIEKAAADKRNAHSLAVVGTHRVAKDISTAVRVVFFEVRAVGGHPGRIATEREHAREGATSHAGNTSDRLKRLLEEVMPGVISGLGRGLQIVELMSRGLDLHGEQMRGTESGTDGKQLLRAAQQVTCTHHQDKRDCYFCDNKRAPHPRMISCGVSRTLLEAGMHLFA